MVARHGHRWAIGFALLLAVSASSACLTAPAPAMPPYILPAATLEPQPSTADALPATPTVAAADVGHLAATPSPAPILDDDWDELTKQALLAEQVLLYSDTARALTSLANMVEAYPGLDAAGRVSSGAELCAMLLHDLQLGAATADLLLTSGTGCVHELVQQGRLVPYAPARLAETLPEGMRAPALTHHWEIVGLHHNDLADPADIPQSWWDLVTSAWAGRVALADPLVDERAMGLLEALLAHDDALRASYGGQLGDQPLADEPATLVWLEALVANGLVLLPSDTEVARWIGDAATQEPRAGFCSSAHWERVLRGELDMQFLLHTAPTVGLRWRTYVAPVAGANNPYGARLALAWLLGDDAGRGGYEPWYQAGLYPARLDVPLPTGSVPRGELTGRLWEVPPVTDGPNRDALIGALEGARGN